MLCVRLSAPSVVARLTVLSVSPLACSFPSTFAGKTSTTFHGNVRMRNMHTRSECTVPFCGPCVDHHPGANTRSRSPSLCRLVSPTHGHTQATSGG